MNMNLEIVEVTGEFTGGFDVPEGYQFEHHWHDQASKPPRGLRRFRQFKVTDSNKEVARFELNDAAERRHFIGSGYPISLVGPPILEIQFIDVQNRFRGRGIGTWIIRGLERENPEVQLLALAEASEEFWQSLGWIQVLPDESDRREMYMSPN